MSSAKRRKVSLKERAAEVANTFEWLITAFVLAFLFRAFVMEAFRIPTGSMADTLKGAHFSLRCRQCAYKYDYGFIQQRYRLKGDYVPGYRVKPDPPPRCPSCGYLPSDGGDLVANGVRILVLKCIYQFLEPRQWDVVVFKNPTSPSINYIKRLIGRPEETIEIIDGDIYVDGQISRKPPKVQKELWMPVYDNDYHPVLPRDPSFSLKNHAWSQPFKNIRGSQWQTGKIFELDSGPEQINTIVYDTSVGNNFRATYAYDVITGYNYMPYCSDLMVRFYTRSNQGHGRIGAILSKYGIVYKGWIDLSAGQMVLAKVIGDNEEILESKDIETEVDKNVLLKLANVDHRLVLEFGSEQLVWDMGTGPDDAGQRQYTMQPQAAIFGSGKLSLSHIAIYRDIHYTGFRRGTNGSTARAGEGNPLKLGKDEFFVMGDNSPNSEDSRWWDDNGVHIGGEPYPKGIVPRDYLVGKALFVYWPSGYRPAESFPLGIIPNLGGMKFIYGGSSSQP